MHTRQDNQLTSTKDIVDRLNDCPDEIQNEIVSYLSNRDFHHFKCAGKKTYGSQTILYHSFKYAADTWKHVAQYPNIYLSIEKNIFLGFFNQFDSYNTATSDEIPVVLLGHVLIAGSFIVSTALMPLALTTYAAGGILSTCEFILGGAKDMAHCVSRAHSPSYAGINTLFPSQARCLQSNQPAAELSEENTRVLNKLG